MLGSISLATIMIYAWALLALVMVIMELALSGVMQIWFAIGAVVAAVIAWLYPGSYLAQLLAFVIVSAVLFLLGSKAFKKESESAPNKNFNRVYSIIDSIGTVTKEINPSIGEGQITINGDKWSAKTKDGSVVPENTKVKIIDIDGVKAVVEVINE